MLEARSLTVVRGRRTILTDVDLALTAGEVVHLAGANGSGKTSLLRVLAGLADPRGGSIQRRGSCAFVPEKVALAGAVQPGEWLAAMRRLRGSAPLDWAAAAAASGLDPDVLRHSSTKLSKGMLQRIALLEALHSEAELLLLDEPFAGLDPSGRDWLAERIAGGASVLLTDHSGAAGERLRPVAEVRLADGRAVRTAIERRTGVRIVASHPDAASGGAAARRRLADRVGRRDMTARLRYVVLCATRTRSSLIPMAGSIFAILGVFAYRGNEVGSTWGLTAVLSCALAAWLVSAALVAEPPAQADMATVAVGGREGRAGLELTLIAIAATGLTVGFIAFPLAVSPLGSTPMFVPDPLPLDILAAAIAHLTCAALGGAHRRALLPAAAQPARHRRGVRRSPRCWRSSPLGSAGRPGRRGPRDDRRATAARSPPPNCWPASAASCSPRSH